MSQFLANHRVSLTTLTTEHLASIDSAISQKTAFYSQSSLKSIVPTVYFPNLEIPYALDRYNSCLISIFMIVFRKYIDWNHSQRGAARDEKIGDWWSSIGFIVWIVVWRIGREWADPAGGGVNWKHSTPEWALRASKVSKSRLLTGSNRLLTGCNQSLTVYFLLQWESKTPIHTS